MPNGKKMVVPVVLGTARPGRASEKVARFVLEELQSLGGVDASLVDVRDFLFGRTTDSGEAGERPERWRSVARGADGFIFVSPEYNHGYPGELKILLDSAYDEYLHKPAAICAVSAGGFGGARMAEQLRLVLLEVGLVPIHSTVYFPRVSKIFGPDGHITDNSFNERLAEMFKEFLWYARVLRAGRQDLG